MRHRVVLFLAAASLFVSPIFAQEFRASLNGRVTDPSGAPVANAKLEVRSATTGVIQNTTTTEDGRYQIPFLDPGSYIVTAEKTGFQRAIREGLQLQIAEKAELNIQMTLGEVSQSVTVAANVGVIETENADRGFAMDAKRVENTPLQGRNIFAQAWSAPGVAVTSGAMRLRPFDIAGSSGIAINGGRPSMNEVLIDGVSNLSRASSVAYVPPVEATDEFRVQTTTFDAQYGWTTGGIVNVLTRSGGNEWHGNLFEFLQNTKLNANTFNNNRVGVPRQSSQINTFGGSIGGPIKKNKLFIFGSYENIRQVIPDPFTTSVPTELQRAGDFSQTRYRNSATGQADLIRIFDPFSTRTDAQGNVIRDMFPGNIIPASRLNPIAVRTLSMIPLGNVAGDPISGLNNLSSSGSTRKFTDFFPQYLVRGDYSINETSRMFIRYSRNALDEQRSFRYSTREAFNQADTSNNSPFTRENHSATVQFTKTLNPTTVLDLRAGLARFVSDGGSSISKGFNVAGLGFDQQFVNQAQAYFPRFNWSDYEGAGANPAQRSVSQTNSFQGSVYKNAGRHTIKTGVDFRILRGYQQSPGFVAGNFSFNPVFTGININQQVQGTGHSIASFLLGTPQSGFIDLNSQPARQQRMFSTYLQDDVRVTDRLKLNVGVRWDYMGPITDRFDALTRGFDPYVASPLQVPGMDVKGGLMYAGVNGNPRGIYRRDLNNFSPRIGAAYRIGEKTVLRGGYALMYAQTFDDPGGVPGYNQATDMVTSIVAGTPFNTLTNPFPSGILQPFGNTQGLATYLGRGFNFSNPNRIVPYTHQFSIEVQRELPGRFQLTVGYVQSRVNGLSVSKPYNEISAADLERGRQNPSYLTASVPNPFAGLLPGTSLNGATVQRQQLLRPFPQFLGLTETNRSEGKSRYDGLQIMVNKRLSAGLSASVAYTFSKTIEQVSYRNAQDTELEKVVAPFHVPHSVQINGVYELPFGRGKALANNANSLVNYMISGWEISGIARLQSGMPMPLNTNTMPTGADPRLTEGQSLDRWFNTAAFVARPQFILQTWSSRLSSVHNPAIRNLDASIIKRNKITETTNLTFRADFLNATNTPQFFSGPNNDVNSPNFGKIAGFSDQSNLPRFIQLSLKLQF